jgi:hypothetical protein
MRDPIDDDPTVPPPGRRTGAGVGSIFPFLVRSLATKPQVETHPDDESTMPMITPPESPAPRRNRPASPLRPTRTKF